MVRDWPGLELLATLRILFFFLHMHLIQIREMDWSMFSLDRNRTLHLEYLCHYSKLPFSLFLLFILTLPGVRNPAWGTCGRGMLWLWCHVVFSLQAHHGRHTTPCSTPCWPWSCTTCKCLCFWSCCCCWPPCSALCSPYCRRISLTLSGQSSRSIIHLQAGQACTSETGWKMPFTLSPSNS